MLLVRRRLSWVVGLWLASQVAGIVAAPLAFCCERAAAADSDETCCPGLAPGQICPMHHKRAGNRHESACKMRDACATADAALVSLAGVVGLLPRATATVSTFEVGDAVSVTLSSAILRACPPDPPPPRA